MKAAFRPGRRLLAAAWAMGTLFFGILPGCGRPPLTAPGPDVTGAISVWGQRRIVAEVHIAEHRVWGLEDDIMRFDDGYRGRSRFGLVDLHPCDGGRTCGIIGGAPTSFTATKDENGRLHGEGSWGPRKFAFDLDDEGLAGIFGTDRYVLKRSDRPALFYRGKIGTNPVYDASVGLPDGFNGLLPEEQTVYLATVLVQ